MLCVFVFLAFLFSGPLEHAPRAPQSLTEGRTLHKQTSVVATCQVGEDENCNIKVSLKETHLLTVVTLIAATAAGTAAVFALLWTSSAQHHHHTYESQVSNIQKMTLKSRRKAARFFSTFSSLRGFCACVALASLGLLTTVNAANPTCADTDGTGTAFSSDLCIADNMLRRSDWASAGTCYYSTCKTSDCCVTPPIAVGVLTNQVLKTDTSVLDYCSGVAVSPDSNNVYTVSQTSDTLVYWTIDADTQVREHLFYHISFATTCICCDALIFDI